MTTKKTFFTIGVAVLLILIISIFIEPKDKGEITEMVQGEAGEEVIEETKEEIEIIGDYKVDAVASLATWYGEKLGGIASHTGTINLASGFVVFGDNTISSGEITFDVASLQNDDDSGDQLNDHLKGPEFFDVEAFSSATFKVNDPVEIKEGQFKIPGEFTLKGETLPLTIMASVSADGEIVKVSGSAEFDRTLWGVSAMSEGLVDQAKDAIVSDTVVLDFTVVLTK